MGYVFSILSSVFFTLYIFPRKFTRQKTYIYTLFMGLGNLIVATVLWIYGYTFANINESFFSYWLLLSGFSGCLWFLATLLFLTAIEKVGLSRASQFKNLQGPIGSLLILFSFSEFLVVNFYFLLISIALIFLSTVFFTIKEKETKKPELSGILFAVLAAIIFGFNAFIKKVVINEGFVYAQQFWHGIFIVLSALVFILIKDKSLKPLKALTKKEKKDNLIAMSAGMFYYLATLSILLSYELILGSVSFIISQLYAVWLILLGIFFFKEVNFKQNRLRIISGFVCILLGLIFLLLAQG